MFYNHEERNKNKQTKLSDHVETVFLTIIIIIILLFS